VGGTQGERESKLPSADECVKEREGGESERNGKLVHRDFSANYLPSKTKAREKSFYEGDGGG